MLSDHLLAGLRMKAVRSESNPVFEIGAWNLDFICYLLFGACDLLLLE